MTKNDNSHINIEAILAERKQIAITWGIEDVQSVRPHLSDDEAWCVLQRCVELHDADYGITWGMLVDVANELYGNDRLPSLSDETPANKEM